MATQTGTISSRSTEGLPIQAYFQHYYVGLHFSTPIKFTLKKYSSVTGFGRKNEH